MLILDGQPSTVRVIVRTISSHSSNEVSSFKSDIHSDYIEYYGQLMEEITKKLMFEDDPSITVVIERVHSYKFNIPLNIF